MSWVVVIESEDSIGVHGPYEKEEALAAAVEGRKLGVEANVVTLLAPSELTAELWRDDS